MARSKLKFAVLALALLSGSACQTSLDITPSGVSKTLSETLLVPDENCQSLRDQFGLGYLPLASNPHDLGFDYESHWITTDTHQVVRLWYIPAQLDRGVVIISNGSSSDLSCYLFPARLLVNDGFSVVMYDYEGFGLSSGVPKVEHLHDDLSAVVDWTLARTGRPQVSLLGISLGTIPSISVGAAHPELINAVIADSPVALGEELKRFDLVLGGQSALVASQVDPRLISEEIVKQLRVPLLVLLHDEDTVTPPASVKLIYDRAPGPKELVRFPNLDHARGEYFDTDKYLFHVDRFLWNVWKPLDPANSAASP